MSRIGVRLELTKPEYWIERELTNRKGFEYFQFVVAGFSKKN